MISNSVTHLQSYTNSAISPETPHEHRYRHIEWRVFRDVLRVFHVLLVVHDVLQCFAMFYNVFHAVLLCLTMFSEMRNDRHRRPHGCQSPQESAITPKKFAMMAY